MLSLIFKATQDFPPGDRALIADLFGLSEWFPHESLKSKPDTDTSSRDAALRAKTQLFRRLTSALERTPATTHHNSEFIQKVLKDLFENRLEDLFSSSDS